MIALCAKHHGFAGGGHITPDDLRRMKANPNKPSHISGAFPWLSSKCLFRYGGNLMPSVVVNRGGEEVLRFSGASLNFVLHSKDGSLIARMFDCVFSPWHAHDVELTASASRLKIWHAQRDIGFEMSFCRSTPDEFVAWWRAQREIAFKDFPELLSRVPTERPRGLDAFIDSDGLIPSWQVARAQLYGPTGGHPWTVERGGAIVT
jgi:hypothetical protein